MTENYQGAIAKLNQVLESDDDAHFMKLLQDHPDELEINNSMVNMCVEFGAKNCLIALIRGEVCDRRPTLNAQQLPETGVTALAYVAYSRCDPEIINLILTECGGTCLVDIGCTIGALHGLPIHFLLFDLSLMDPLYYWVRGGSLVKLIFLFCLPEMKPILDSLRLLAQYTDSINDIAWTMLKNGGLKQFVALLLVAREKVIAPFDTGLTIVQYVTIELDSFTKGELSYQEEEYKCLLKDAWKFLALFEVAGDDLISYCSSVQKNVSAADVVVNVTDLLLKNRVNVTQFDVKLYDCDIDCHVLTRPFFLKLYHAYDMKKFCLHPATHSAYDNYFGRRGKPPFLEIPKLACLGNQPRHYSTGAYQSTKISPLPRHLAYFTSKFINRFRFL